jgi:hypothetical protein
VYVCVCVYMRPPRLPSPTPLCLPTHSFNGVKRQSRLLQKPHSTLGIIASNSDNYDGATKLYGVVAKSIDRRTYIFRRGASLM